MPIIIDPATLVINIPQSYLTPLGGSLYELDMGQFRLDLIDWEDSEDGVWLPPTHKHATEVILSGVTYARTIEILFPYTVLFENTGFPYTVRCAGANHNLADVLNAAHMHVSLVIGNSAGLITVASGSGVTEQDKLDIADRVWDEVMAGHGVAGSTGLGLTGIKTKTDLLPDGVQKNAPLSNFLFTMLDSEDHVTPKDGLVVTARRIIDNGTLLPCTNPVVGVGGGSGAYRINFSAADLNGDNIWFLMTAPGADPLTFSVKTQT